MSELNLSMDSKSRKDAFKLHSDTVITHEASEEFSLPDYVPEVRRVLYTRAQALPDSKYLSAQGGLEIEGTVAYSVIYTDDEGNLCSTPLTTQYQAKASVSPDTASTSIDTWVDSVVCRATAPRRLSIKSRLKSRIIATGKENTEEKIAPWGNDTELYIERKQRNEMGVRLTEARMENIRFTDTLEMKGHKSAKPIWCDAVSVISDARTERNGINVRGEILVKCLCETESGFDTLTKRLPLAEIMECSGIDQEHSARVEARCVSLSISNEESDSETKLFFELSCELEAEVMKNEELTLTEDAYSTKCVTEQSYRDISLFKMVKAQQDSISINEGVKRENNGIQEIIELICDPVYEKTEFKGRRAVATGHIDLCIIGKSLEGDKEEYLSEVFYVPFKHETEIDTDTQSIIPRYSFSLKDVSASLENGRMNFRCELYTSYSLLEKKDIRILDTAALISDRAVEKDPSLIRVCFPNENDTLWSIAKRYSTPLKEICENNGISPDLDTCPDRLII